MPDHDGGAPALDTPFRPRWARWVTIPIGLAALAGAVFLAVLVWDWAGPVDGISFAVFGLLVAWFCWRQASVQARPDDDGLVVRNLLLTRRLEWAQIVSVRFGQGRPWVQLDLDDGDTLAVMGIQRADGAYAEREARRLATLVARHTRP